MNEYSKKSQNIIQTQNKLETENKQLKNQLDYTVDVAEGAIIDSVDQTEQIKQLQFKLDKTKKRIHHLHLVQDEKPLVEQDPLLITLRVQL